MAFRRSISRLRSGDERLRERFKSIGNLSEGQIVPDMSNHNISCF